MKTTFALLLGLVAGTASFAQTTQEPIAQTPQPTVVVTNDQKIRLFVEASPVMARIELTDATGHILYTGTQTLAQGLRQQFDLSELDEGTYQLAIVTGQQTQTKTFTVQRVTTPQQIITVHS